MRKFHIILAGILFTFLFTTCKQFTADIEEDLSYWASEAFITGDTILSGYKTDTNGTRCVASKDGAAVTLTVRNPKAFSFDIPSITASSLIHFNGLAAQPQHGADYTLRQTGPNTLKLTYTQDFLKKYEQGTADLGPTIALKASDGRVFNKAYTFSIKSNSPPPTPAVVLAKTSGSPAYYVLCLQFDSTEMTRTMGSGTVPVHKDISSITINGSPYALLYKDDNSDFQKPAETPPIGSFIEHGGAAPLTASSPALPPASEKWVLYFKTDIEVESINAQTLYTITLSDNKGVVSDSVTAGLKAKFKVEFDVNDGDPTSKPANQYIENGGTVTLPSSNPTRTGYTFGGWYTDTSYSTQWDFDNNTVTHNITLYAKWNNGTHIQYNIEHYKQNIDDNDYTIESGDTQTLYGTTNDPITVTPKNYTGFEFDHMDPASPTIAADGSTVVKVYYKRTTYNVNFSVNGSNGSIAATNVIGGSVTGSSVTVKHGGSVTFTAQPDNGWEVDSWTGVTASPSSSTTATLSNVTSDTTVTVTFRQKTYTVTYSVVGAEGGTIQAGSGTPITSRSTKQVVEGGSVTFTASPATGWEVDSWTVSPGSFASGGTTGAANARLDNITENKTVTVKFKRIKYTITFSVDGGNGTISARPQGDSENSTGSVSVEYGKNVTFTAHPHNGYEVDSWSSNVTPQSPNTTATLTVTAPATVTVTFRQKTYTVRFSVANGEGTLQGSYGSQNPTTQNGGGIKTLTNVPHGTSVTFTAAPDNGWELDSWTGVSPSALTASLTVDGPKTVTVKFKPGEFKLEGGPDAWKKLKKEAAKSDGAHTIIIDGEIKATGDSGNNGDITPGRDLTIKGKGSSDVLNADGRSRIFNVQSGKMLTLKNITLKNGQASGGQGGGVYVDGTLVMEDSSTITDCHAGEGGGVYVNGTFKMSGSAKVDTNSDVYLASGKSIDVTGTLTNTPAAQITLASGNYYDGRVLATGNAEKANFKVTPKNGNEHWRYKKKDGVIKFVKAELKVTFVEIKCIRVDDNGSTAEYYWTMKVDGQMKSERQESHPWDAGNGARFPINESFTRTFSSFPVNAIPVNIDIWEDDNVDDDHIAITKAKLTYDYDSDQWRWTYDGSQLNGDNEGNTSANSDIRIGDGDEKTFTEHYFTRDGDTDVTIKISWKE